MPSTNDEYAPSAWASAEYDFVLPSGDKVLLRKIDPLSLGEYGLMDKLDFATSVVMNTHVKNANLSPAERVKRDRARRAAKANGQDPDEVLQETEMLDIVKNAEHSKKFREVMDEVLTIAVAKPTVELPPEDVNDKKAGHFYTDAVPFSDKMAIFNKVMEGVRSIEQFREGSQEGVGDVAPKPVVRKSTQRSTSNRKRPAR